MAAANISESEIKKSIALHQRNKIMACGRKRKSSLNENGGGAAINGNGGEGAAIKAGRKLAKSCGAASGSAKAKAENIMEAAGAQANNERRRKIEIQRGEA